MAYSNCESSRTLAYTYPEHSRDAGPVFNAFYYGVAIPVSYVGNLFTYIIVCKLLQYRDSTADVLVGGLALNDVLTAIIVFTPSLISAARGRYFGSREMCEFSAVTTVWYIYTTFAMIVLINAERWLAITKPFFYKRLSVTGFKLKVIMGLQGFFCLMLASTPLFVYPVTLKAGWYCAPVHISCVRVPTAVNNYTNSTVSNHTSAFTTTITDISPVQETIYIKLIYLVIGIVILLSSNIGVAYALKSRPFGDAASREMDRKFARIMIVVACLFLLTWLPNLAAQVVCLAKSAVCQKFEFWAMRIVNIGVAVNPFVYGVMKTTYRRGYLYLARVTLHYLTCTLVPLPSYGAAEIFDLRERFQRRISAIYQSSSSSGNSSNTGPHSDRELQNSDPVNGKPERETTADKHQCSVQGCETNKSSDDRDRDQQIANESQDCSVNDTKQNQTRRMSTSSCPC